MDGGKVNKIFNSLRPDAYFIWEHVYMPAAGVHVTYRKSQIGSQDLFD